jgi:hypothetical protein
MKTISVSPEAMERRIARFDELKSQSAMYQDNTGIENKGVAGGLPATVQQNLLLRNTDLAEMFRSGRVPASAAEVSCERIDVPHAKDTALLHACDAWVNFCAGDGVALRKDLKCDPDQTQAMRDERRRARVQSGVGWSGNPRTATTKARARCCSVAEKRCPCTRWRAQPYIDVIAVARSSARRRKTCAACCWLPRIQCPRSIRRDRSIRP